MDQPLIFVTGATGLLGNHVVATFIAQGYRVRALVRDAEKAKRVLPSHPQLETVVGDLETADNWLGAMEGCHAVVHAAAYFREYFGRGEHDQKLTKLNVVLLVRIVQKALALGVTRIVMVSSTGAISQPKDGKPVNEQSEANGQLPNNGYQQSKVEMEKALAKLGLPASQLVIIRPGWMFGPNDFAPTGAGEIVKDILRQRSFQFMDGPAFAIADARDVAAGIVAATVHPNPAGLYCLAGNNLRPLAAIRMIAGEAGKKVTEVPVPMARLMSRMLELPTRLLGKRNPLPLEGIEVLSTNFAVDSSLAERDLGVRFRPFEETARDTVAFFKG